MIFRFIKKTQKDTKIEIKRVSTPESEGESSVVNASTSSQATGPSTRKTEPCDHWSYLDKYFEYMGPKGEQNLEYKYFQCLLNKNLLLTSNKSQNNLKRHVSKRHSYVQNQFNWCIKAGVVIQKSITYYIFQ